MCLSKCAGCLTPVSVLSLCCEQARELVRLEEARAERREAAADEPRPPLAPFARHPLAAEEPRWDCESVLSLRSNADNHPALLGEPGRRRWRPDPTASPAIRLSAKTGLPVGFTGAANERGGRYGGGVGSAAGATGGCGDGASAAGDSVASAARRRGESAEEKRVRKAAVKETRVRLGVLRGVGCLG